MSILEIGTSSSDSILQLLGVSILFIFILAITYYTTRFVGGVKLGQTKKGNFKVLETYKIAPNKYLQLVKIGTRYFAISVGKEDIRFIAELNKNEIVQQEHSAKQNSNFLEIISKVINKQNDNKQNDIEHNEKIQNDDQEFDHK